MDFPAIDWISTKDPSPKARDQFGFVIPVHPEFSGFLESQPH